MRNKAQPENDFKQDISGEEKMQQIHHRQREKKPFQNTLFSDPHQVTHLASPSCTVMMLCPWPGPPGRLRCAAVKSASSRAEPERCQYSPAGLYVKVC